MLRFMASFVTVLVALLVAGCVGFELTAPTPSPTYPFPPPDQMPPLVTESPPVPDPEPIHLSGPVGLKTDKFQLLEGLSIFTIKYGGSDRFIVSLMDKNGRQVELLVNNTGPYNGSQSVGINSSGDYFLDVQASGPWTIMVTQPRQRTGLSIPMTITGNGPIATGLIRMDSSPTTFRMKYYGEGFFQVKLFDDKGNLVETLVDVEGAHGLSKAIYHFPGYYVLNVRADDRWEIEMGQSSL